tara:strand:+ start:1350 stop:1523 length:174 start_codon:yes stop_codon:yes gene_type:complete
MFNEIKASMTVLMLQLVVRGEMETARLVQEAILDLHRLQAMEAVLSALNEEDDDLKI